MMVVISSLEIMESEFKMQKIQQLVGGLERLMELLYIYQGTYFRTERIKYRN